MQTYSRRQNIEAKENKRKATGFFLLSLAVIAFMYFFGLPLLTKVSNFAYDLRGSGEPIDPEDQTPPPPPLFDELPEYTNMEKLELKGNSEPGVTILIYINERKTEILVNNEGRFTHEFNVSDGKNTIYAFAKDTAGNESRKSSTLEIYFDKEKPPLEILSPKNGQVLSGSRNRQIRIEGTTESDAKVLINGHLSIVDSSGKFSFSTNLSEGENKFKVESQDPAGNISEQEVSVTFYP